MILILAHGCSWQDCCTNIELACLVGLGYDKVPLAGPQRMNSKANIANSPLQAASEEIDIHEVLQRPGIEKVIHNSLHFHMLVGLAL